MRILAFCDSPTTQSGFARVAQNLFKRWKGMGAEIDVWGVGFTGWGYRRIPYVDTIYPAGAKWHQGNQLELFLRQLEIGNEGRPYTHTWLMQDTFLLSGYGFPAALKALCQARKIRSMLYFPVDAPLDPAWTDIIAAVDVPVAYTSYGEEQAVRGLHARWQQVGAAFEKNPKDEMVAGLLELHKGQSDIEVMPHGVDTDVYRVLPGDREKLRAELWKMADGKPWLGPHDFLLINVNANQRRKDVCRSLEVLAELKRKGVPAKLWMHMSESSDGWLSLEVVGHQLGLVPLRDWAHAGRHFINGNRTLGEADLARFYNAADLYLTTTLGEGWGLPITEALACGCPVAIPGHTSCAEIAKAVSGFLMDDRVVVLPTEHFGVMMDGDNSRVRHRVKVAPAAELIADYHASGKWKKRTGLTDNAEWWLDWNRIAQTMLKLLKRPASAKAKELKAA